MFDWWTALVKLDALDKRAQRLNHPWAPVLRKQTDRLRRVIADGCRSRADLYAAVEHERHLALADPVLARGSWREDQLNRYALGLATPAELLELDKLARDIGNTMAAAQAST